MTVTISVTDDKATYNQLKECIQTLDAYEKKYENGKYAVRVMIVDQRHYHLYTNTSIDEIVKRNNNDLFRCRDAILPHQHTGGILFARKPKRLVCHHNEATTELQSLLLQVLCHKCAVVTLLHVNFELFFDNRHGKRESNLKFIQTLVSLITQQPLLVNLELYIERLLRSSSDYDPNIFLYALLREDIVHNRGPLLMNFKIQTNNNNPYSDSVETRWKLPARLLLHLVSGRFFQFLDVFVLENAELVHDDESVQSRLDEFISERKREKNDEMIDVNNKNFWLEIHPLQLQRARRFKSNYLDARFKTTTFKRCTLNLESWSTSEKDMDTMDDDEKKMAIDKVERSSSGRVSDQVKAFSRHFTLLMTLLCRNVAEICFWHCDIQPCFLETFLQMISFNWIRTARLEFIKTMIDTSLEPHLSKILETNSHLKSIVYIGDFNHSDDELLFYKGRGDPMPEDVKIKREEERLMWKRLKEKGKRTKVFGVRADLAAAVTLKEKIRLKRMSKKIWHDIFSAVHQRGLQGRPDAKRHGRVLNGHDPTSLARHRQHNDRKIVKGDNVERSSSGLVNIIRFINPRKEIDSPCIKGGMWDIFVQSRTGYLPREDTE